MERTDDSDGNNVIPENYLQAQDGTIYLWEDGQLHNTPEKGIQDPLVESLKRYIWELERTMFLIIIESKHNNGRQPYSDKVWDLAEEVLDKRPKDLEIESPNL